MRPDGRCVARSFPAAGSREFPFRGDTVADASVGDDPHGTERTPRPHPATGGPRSTRVIESVQTYFRTLADTHPKWSFIYLYDPVQTARIGEGLWMTVQLSVACVVLSVLIGVVGAWLQGSRSTAVRAVVQGYIRFFRNTPPLIQLLFFYFALGQFTPTYTRRTAGSRFRSSPTSAGRSSRSRSLPGPSTSRASGPESRRSRSRPARRRTPSGCPGSRSTSTWCFPLRSG